MSDLRPDSLAAPELVAEGAVSCIEYVRRATGVTLDFNPETLSVLDHYATSLRGDLASRPEIVTLIARAVGCYFGEVIRARFPSFWRIPSDNVRDWQLCSRDVFLWFNPIGLAYDALYGNDEHEGPRSQLRVAPNDREFLSARLAAMPPVSEEEFCLLTTRYEVIEASIEALALRLEQQGEGGTEFGEDDYAAEFLPPVLN